MSPNDGWREEDAGQIRTTHWIASEGRFGGREDNRQTRACPICGTLFPDNSETCPVCALRGALGSEQTVSQSVGATLSRSEFRFEHYEVLSCDDGTPLELGRGAMGVTYKAVDVNLRCAVVLKVISAQFAGDESARRRFVREARAAASVRHPNVASVFHLGKSGDSYFYAMEFVEGQSLDKVPSFLLKKLPRASILGIGFHLN
jgi:Protein kinase domain